MLELFLFKGQYQLCTPDAIYSDGDRYRPLVLAFKQLKAKLPEIKKVLVLGGGLGSAVQVLDSFGFRPSCTLIDCDRIVLDWSVELMRPHLRPRVTVVCKDAEEYVDKETELYDLVIVDVFTGRIVPGFVTSQKFLENCRRRLLPGGHIVINYIINSKQDWTSAAQNIDAVFPNNKKPEHGINEVIIAPV